MDNDEKRWQVNAKQDIFQQTCLVYMFLSPDSVHSDKAMDILASAGPRTLDGSA